MTRSNYSPQSREELHFKSIWNCFCVQNFDVFIVKFPSFGFWAAGFANPLGYCCGHYGDYYVQCGKKAIINGTEVAGDACSDPSVYISWDGVHYSHAANRWVAQQILDGFLSDPQIPITQACHKPVDSWWKVIHLTLYPIFGCMFACFLDSFY